MLGTNEFSKNIYSMKSFIIAVSAALFFAANVAAQSLADVLSSIQERKQVLEQRKQVEIHLQRIYTTVVPPQQHPEILNQVLINWEGLGAIFPTESNTEGLGIDARISLLNQAIRELRYLQTRYLNFRKEDLVLGAKAGAMRPYMLEDFPDPGRAGADNYHQVLRLLAQSVSRLSVTEWPVAGLKQVSSVILPYDPNNAPTSAGPGTVVGDGVWKFSNLIPMIERCTYADKC